MDIIYFFDYFSALSLIIFLTDAISIISMLPDFNIVSYNNLVNSA